MMEGMLKRGQVLIARNMQSAAVIEDTLGEGAQAEVYRARIGDAHYALKWYRPEYLAGDQIRLAHSFLKLHAAGLCYRRRKMDQPQPEWLGYRGKGQ